MKLLMTNDILLRDVIESDLPIFFEQQLDPEATAMAAFPPRDRDAFMLHWRKIMSDKSVILKTILYDGQVAGNIVSWETLGEREIGYWLGKEFWGRGIASESLRQFLGVVRSRPLFAHVARHNVASKRVLEKCGFTAIGEDKYLDRNGKEVEEIILKLNGHGNDKMEAV
jgi:RimJ/RimL family protein N-acetyltransferase